MPTARQDDLDEEDDVDEEDLKGDLKEDLKESEDADALMAAGGKPSKARKTAALARALEG